MIDVAISYGFGDDNRYNTRTIPPEIQLASYKFDPMMNNLLGITNALLESKTKLHVVHLPLNTLSEPAQDILDVMFHFNQVFACQHFVIHPNKGIEDFLWYYLEHKKVRGRFDYSLCIETFQWRKKKKIRSPIDIMEWCIRYPEFSMCLDTSHIETMWFDHKIMCSLLKYTSVIHLSNRAKGYGSHMPFNSQKGELQLVSFVKDLKHRYHWNGIIVLEYMPEYQDKLYKNYKYIQRLLE